MPLLAFGWKVLPHLSKCMRLGSFCQFFHSSFLSSTLWKMAKHNSSIVPASVAQLDARPTGDQEVAGSTPVEVGNILWWRLIMKYFLRSFSPFR